MLPVCVWQIPYGYLGWQVVVVGVIMSWHAIVHSYTPWRACGGVGTEHKAQSGEMLPMLVAGW